MTRISLEYGLSERWESDLPDEQLLFAHRGPEPLVDPLGTVKDTLHLPLEYPALELALVPGDRVVIVLVLGVPSSAEIISVTWSSMATAGIEAENVIILQLASMISGQ